MKKSFGIILLILVLLLACGVGALTYFYMGQDARIKKLETKVASFDSTEKTEKASNKADDEEEVEETEENEVEEETETTTSEITYESLEGLYEVDAENEDGLKNKLALYKDGTFSYSHGAESVENYSGNYVIDGNKLLMNVWFKLDSSTSSVKDCFKTNENFELTVKSNGKTIVDANDFEELATSRNNTYTVKLSKTETEAAGDINEIIYDYIKNFN